MSLALSVSSVSKKYTIGVYNAFEWLRRRYDNKNSQWALYDVSFDAQKGEVIGLIGDNGAGKSTLLKILSRITYPTKGNIEIFGSIGSVLEIGAGFHPELTGLENVYLNGSILGMGRKEIRKRLKEIVNFSEVGNFLDTPVKRYSSGMKLRLAFSVATHLNAEILLLDEVFSVFDETFQERCLEKVKALKKNGITLIIVSHSINALSKLADRCIWLENGIIKKIGKSEIILRNYEMKKPTKGLEPPARSLRMSCSTN